MASTLKPMALLIDSRASNHMMASKYSFSSLNTSKSIPIHMGDDSTIISKGQGTVNLEHSYFSNVLYVPSLASNLLSVYQMTHTGVPKRVSISPDDVKITEIAYGKLVAKGSVNHHAKAYEFSHFVEDANPTSLMTHGNEVSRLWNEIFGHLNFNYLQQLHKNSMVEGIPAIKTSKGICKGCIMWENNLSTSLIGERKYVHQVYWS